MKRFIGKRWGLGKDRRDRSATGRGSRRSRPSRRRAAALEQFRQGVSELLYRSAVFQPLEERVMLDIGGVGSQPPTIVVGRTLSAYDVPDVQNNQETLTFTVYNQAADPITGVLLTDTLANGVTFASASQLPDQNGQQLAWSLGAIQPYNRASVTLTVSLASPTPTVLDTGASAYGTLDAGMVSWTTAPATLRATAIAPALLASTPDANTTDPFVQEKAAELNYDPTQIYNFLQTQIGYNSYVGSLRGARGTLWSSAGNSLDDASLGVALMRASGIPAQYEEGTLTTAQAQQLILSMFPASFQTVGYIPAGTQTADPANDPQLLSETKDHFWFQFDAGSGMKDADPEFASQAVGQTATTSTNSFTKVPDELRQHVEVKLNVEETNGFALLEQGLLTALGGSAYSTTAVLDKVFNSVDLVGRPLTIGSIVSVSLVQTILSPAEYTYSPYISVADLANGANTQFLRGTDYQEVLSGYPLANQYVTGEFLNVTLTGPGLQQEVYQRTISDRIGTAARDGQLSNTSLTNQLGPAITGLDITTLNVFAGQLDPLQSVAQTALARRLADPAREAVTQTLASDGTFVPGKSELTTVAVLAGILQGSALSFAALSDGVSLNLANAFGVRAYFDRPRLILASIHPEQASNTASTLDMSMDLVRDSVRAISDPGQAPDASMSYNFFRGLYESTLEGAVLPTGGAALSRATTAVAIIDAALSQGASIVVIDASNLNRLATLGLSPDVEARISMAIDAGHHVLVPTKSVLVDGAETTAWFDVDPVTGESIGVLPDGSHGGKGFFSWLGEQAATYAASQFSVTNQETALSFVFGAVTGLINGEADGIALLIASAVYGVSPNAAAVIAALAKQLKNALVPLCLVETAVVRFAISTVNDNPAEITAASAAYLSGCIIASTNLFGFFKTDPPVPMVAVQSVKLVVRRFAFLGKSAAWMPRCNSNEMCVKAESMGTASSIC